MIHKLFYVCYSFLGILSKFLDFFSCTLKESVFTRLLVCVCIMKIISIQLFHCPTSGSLPVLLCASYELSSLSYFQKSRQVPFIIKNRYCPEKLFCRVKEMVTFFGRTFAQQMPLHTESRRSIEHQDYICHVSMMTNQLAIVLFADAEYPKRVAFTVLQKIMDDFNATVSREQYQSVPKSFLFFGYILVIQEKTL